MGAFVTHVRPAQGERGAAGGAQKPWGRARKTEKEVPGFEPPTWRLHEEGESTSSRYDMHLGRAVESAHLALARGGRVDELTL